MEFLYDYGLFLAQAITIVVAIGAVLVLALGLSRRGGGSTEEIEVKHINRQFEEIERSLEYAMLSKHELKSRQKAQKAKDKADEKTRKRAAKDKTEDAPAVRPRLFILDFEGDIRASGAGRLRDEINALLTLATDRDEVLVRVENAGGVVHGHGLAASQLARIRDRGIPLTVAIDKVAASGGYMMACVANQIVAAPFAIVGSIGVLAQIPNFKKVLDRVGVDVELIKAGEHKRSLTFFGENTEEDRAKMQSDIDNVHTLFKAFVTQYRPTLDIDSVATGDHWFGTEALERGLVDSLQTSDDYVLAAIADRDVYTIEVAQKKALGERLAEMMSLVVEKVGERILTQGNAR